MSKLVVATGMLVVAGVSAAVYVQHQSNSALHRELALLRQELRQTSSATVAPAPASRRTETPLAGSGDAGAVRSDELAKLRGEITALRKSADEIAKFTQLAQAAAAAKTLQSADSTPLNLIPANALKNAGKTTPEAATETALWAAVAGEVDALANSFAFTPSARSKADAWFAGFSDATRQQYGSPEKVIALMVAKDAAGLTGMQVIGQKEINPDNVGVRVRFASTDGRTKEDTLVMQRANDGWRMLLSDQVVEKFARQVGGKK